MSSKDVDIKLSIEEILQNNTVGQKLITYFESMPYQNLRRAITILSRIYPDKTVVSDDEFNFITYMFSNEIFINQESFYEFVRSTNIISYSKNQKVIFINIIKKHLEILCLKCTFELDNLIMKLFEPHDLIEYMEIQMKDSDTAVLEHFSDILRYEDFSNSKISDEKLQMMKQTLYSKLKRPKLK